MSANRTTAAPALSGLSSETQSSIRHYLERKYQRTDFDLLEWADADEVANYVFDGAVESDEGLGGWGAAAELAAGKMLIVYLDGGQYTTETLTALIGLIDKHNA
jgi:hypothetical protein